MKELTIIYSDIKFTTLFELKSKTKKVLCALFGMLCKLLRTNCSNDLNIKRSSLIERVKGHNGEYKKSHLFNIILHLLILVTNFQTLPLDDFSFCREGLQKFESSM